MSPAHFDTEQTMHYIRLLIAAARVVAVVIAVGLFIEVGPTMASHEPVHAATQQARGH
jgi:hypothetical protein